MAVHKRSYHGYAGEFTPGVVSLPDREPATLTRERLSSKFIVAYFAICFFYPLGCALALYMNHNQRLLAIFNLSSFFDVDATFFYHFMNVQGVMAFILTALVGPGLVSPDLANNALPLYFCRPFSRAEYVLGKMFVLVLHALAGHLDSGRDPVSDSVQPRGRKLDVEQPVDGGQAFSWARQLRSGFLAAGPGSLGVDQAEDWRRARRCWACSFSAPASGRPSMLCYAPRMAP